MLKLILFTIFLIGYALHGWWRSRHPEDEEPSDWPGQKHPPRPGSGAQPPAAPGPPAHRAASWEEELRRLLQGQPPPAAPAPPPLPAPRATAPAPSARARLLSKPAPRPVASAGMDSDMAKGLPVSLPGLSQSARAYGQASKLDLRIADRMRQVEQQVVAHKPADARREVSVEVRQALSLVRDRTSLRAAILAGVILGPPRGLEL